ncbi:glucose-6-phosphate 3-dehydrogenase [Lachnospiraceae bacterium]|nr:glucose-6-phosphate 3-dehydrogenase [Lachnospiraceae bacterium]
MGTEHALYLVIDVAFHIPEDNMGSKVIGIRGVGGHGSRLMEEIKSINSDVRFVVLPRKIEDWRYIDVSDMRGLIISCPNVFHQMYCKYATSRFPHCVIYCEKPFLNKRSSLASGLDLLHNSNIILGFNYRHSATLRDILGLADMLQLGDILNVSIRFSYPFCLKQEFKSSWKSDADMSPSGVLENLSIHFIDLFQYLYGFDSLSGHFSCFRNGIPMTTDLTGRSNTDIGFNLHCSYAEPCEQKLELIFKNGIISVTQNLTEVRAPTLVLETKTGMCVESPVVYSMRRGFLDIGKDSRREAMKYFLGIAFNDNKEEKESMLNSERSLNCKTIRQYGLLLEKDCDDAHCEVG